MEKRRQKSTVRKKFKNGPVLYSNDGFLFGQFYLQTHRVESHVSRHRTIQFVRSDQERDGLGIFFGIQGNRSSTLGLLHGSKGRGRSQQERENSGLHGVGFRFGLCRVDDGWLPKEGISRRRGLLTQKTLWIARDIVQPSEKKQKESTHVTPRFL
jgi:hypothetical protein